MKAITTLSLMDKQERDFKWHMSESDIALAALMRASIEAHIAYCNELDAKRLRVNVLKLA